MKKMVLLKDDFRDTALHLSACQGEVGIVKLLLARGAEVDAENNLGSTPLNRAAVAGKTEVRVCPRRYGQRTTLTDGRLPSTCHESVFRKRGAPSAFAGVAAESEKNMLPWFIKLRMQVYNRRGQARQA